MEFKLILLALLVNAVTVCGQCTFQSPFADSTWLDNTRGTLVFTSTTMSGWGLTILGQNINEWQCADSSDSAYIVIRSQNAFTYSSNNLYAYLCMTVTKITDYSYRYYHQHDVEPNAGSERLKISTSDSLTLADVCEFGVVVPTLEFHVLVKSGNEVDATITCADTLLYTADYSYSDGTNTACEDTVDSWDVCTDTTKMSFNYTTCSQEIAYSAGGQLYCVANMAAGGYQCSVVYNTDVSIVGTTRRFSCICSNGAIASVAPNNCTSDQVPYTLPTEADGTTTTGHLVTYGTQFVYCGPESSSSSGGVSVGLIAGVVVGVLIVIAAAGIGIYCYLRHRKNKVSESEKPMLSNGAVAHAETVNETSRAVPKREKSSVSAISRNKSDMDKSLIQRNTTMSSIGLSMKREKSNITQVQPKEKDDTPEKTATLLGFNVMFLPCFKPKGVTNDEKQEKKEDDTEVKKQEDESKGPFLSILPCFKKKEEIKQEDVKPEEPPAPVPVQKKPEPKAKAPPKKGKGAKKGAKGKGKAGGKGKKSQESQTEKKKEMDIADVDETDKVESTLISPRREKSSLGPTMTSTPKPEPSQKSPQLSKRNGNKPESARNGSLSPKVPAVVNGLVKPTSTESKEWTFLMCCFGNRSPPPQEDTHPTKDEPVQPVEEKKPPPKGKKGAGAKAKPGAKKPTPKKGGKKGGGKAKKDDNKNAEKLDVASVGEPTDENKLERAKTMPERQREKTALSVTDAERVKVDVYIPDENSQLQLKDTVTVVKSKNGDVPNMEKSKSSLGLARPASSTSRASSIKKKPAKANEDKAKKGKKSEKGAKGGKEKKATKKKKK